MSPKNLALESPERLIKTPTGVTYIGLKSLGWAQEPALFKKLL